MTFKAIIKKAILAATMITATAPALIATEASAAGYYVTAAAETANFPQWDYLNARKWPAAHSEKLFHMSVGTPVFVERCIIKSGTDWCKVHDGKFVGWVNGKYIVRNGQNFAAPHAEGYKWH